MGQSLQYLLAYLRPIPKGSKEEHLEKLENAAQSLGVTGDHPSTYHERKAVEAVENEKVSIFDAAGLTS